MIIKGKNMDIANRYVVVGGADIGDYAYIKSLLREDDLFIYCDSGLRHMEGLGRRPDLVVGDFDSHDIPHLDCETIILPREKTIQIHLLLLSRLYNGAAGNFY